jgi:hypothetical protein
VIISYTPSAISHCTSISLGHDEPPIKFTYIANEQRGKTFNAAASLTGGSSTGTAAFNYAKVNSSTIQAAEDMVCPRITRFTLMVA